MLNIFKMLAIVAAALTGLVEISLAAAPEALAKLEAN